MDGLQPNIRAVSRSKCNKLMIMTFETEVVWHEEFGGALPAESFSRPSVELPSDGIELSLREVGQVGAFREILAQQAMGVLVDAALPRAVRIGEIDGAAGHFGKAGPFRDLDRRSWKDGAEPRSG